MIRTLRLDYVSIPGAGRLGIIMLVAGVIFGTWALLEYRAVRIELSEQAAKTEEVRKSGKRTAANVRADPREAQAAAQEYKLAQLALQRLALRWDDLFTALESTRMNGVALLAIEPDAARNVVKLTAEAKSAEDMLGYIESLQASGGLADVMLASHQVKPTDPLQPMRFVVLASWVK